MAPLNLGVVSRDHPNILPFDRKANIISLFSIKQHTKVIRRMVNEVPYNPSTYSVLSHLEMEIHYT